MSAPHDLLLYAPVAVWAATGLGLLLAFRGSAPPVVLRLAAAFLALWALVATTALVWVLTHGGGAAIVPFLVQPSVLFAPESAGLWGIAGGVVLVLLSAAFLVNQAVGHGLLRLLRPTPVPWPSGLPVPSATAYLGRFASDRLDAFSFTLVARSAGGGGRIARRDVVLISERLWTLLDAEERRAVVAHELGHLVALDSRYLTFLRTAARMLRWDPFFAVIAAVLTRREELRADGLAVRWTGRPEALASALRKAAVGAAPAAGWAPGRALLGGARDRAFVAERIARLRSLSPKDRDEGA